jgi:hypothetical protein
MAAALALIVTSSGGGGPKSLKQAGSPLGASPIAQTSPSARTTLTASPTAVTVSSPPALTATPGPSLSAGGSATTQWTLDLFDKAGVRQQNPDGTACTAASVQTSLNLIAMQGEDTRWSVTTTYEMQESILDYERSNMTMPTAFAGSDPHGTRNALNYFGWRSMQAGVYVDAAYTTFNAVAKAVVSSVAKTHKPAIVFAWMGGHAQVITGYQVRGQNPAISDNFIVSGVYLTDPFIGTASLVYDGVNHKVTAVDADTFVTLANWKAGPDAVQFSRYWQLDSTLTDPIDGRVGRREWYNKWVVVLAMR